MSHSIIGQCIIIMQMSRSWSMSCCSGPFAVFRNVTGVAIKKVFAGELHLDKRTVSSSPHSYPFDLVISGLILPLGNVS